MSYKILNQEHIARTRVKRPWRGEKESLIEIIRSSPRQIHKRCFAGKHSMWKWINKRMNSLEIFDLTSLQPLCESGEAEESLLIVLLQYGLVVYENCILIVFDHGRLPLEIILKILDASGRKVMWPLRKTDTILWSEISGPCSKEDAMQWWLTRVHWDHRRKLAARSMSVAMTAEASQHEVYRCYQNGIYDWLQQSSSRHDIQCLSAVLNNRTFHTLYQVELKYCSWTTDLKAYVSELFKHQPGYALNGIKNQIILTYWTGVLKKDFYPNAVYDPELKKVCTAEDYEQRMQTVVALDYNGLDYSRDWHARRLFGLFFTDVRCTLDMLRFDGSIMYLLVDFIETFAKSSYARMTRMEPINHLDDTVTYRSRDGSIGWSHRPNHTSHLVAAIEALGPHLGLTMIRTLAWILAPNMTQELCAHIHSPHFPTVKRVIPHPEYS
jgi:hypothetical protein